MEKKQKITFGQGKHYVEFTCGDIIIEYHSHTLTGITKTLKKFKKGIKKLRENILLYTYTIAMKDAKPFGYKWLAAHCRNCRVIIKDDNDNLIWYNVKKELTTDN